VKKIGMVIKPTNPEAARFGSEVATWVEARGGKVYLDRTFTGMISPAVEVDPEDIADEVDVMVVLGGDGTMLYAARLISGRNVPILGVNMGGLGFLTAITTEEAYGLLERVLADDFKVEERMMLFVDIRRDGESLSSYRVLNDAVIKGTTARLVKLETSINREYVTTYRSDGLIIASPTGSTAYSLSAQGPILYPTIHSIIVAPICPFNLTNRPVVIPDWMTVDVTVCYDQSNIQLILDGQVDVPVECGDTIHVRRASTSVYLVRYEGKSYFDILRERLMWEVK